MLRTTSVVLVFLIIFFVFQEPFIQLEASLVQAISLSLKISVEPYKPNLILSLLDSALDFSIVFSNTLLHDFLILMCQKHFSFILFLLIFSFYLQETAKQLHFEIFTIFFHTVFYCF